MQSVRQHLSEDQSQYELDILYHLAHDLVHSPDIRTIGDVLFAHVKKRLNADYGDLMVVNDCSTELRGVAAYGIGMKDFHQERIDIEKEPAAAALAFQQKQVVVVSDYTTNPLVSERLQNKYHFLQDVWSAPLMSGPTLVGIFSIGYLTSQEASPEKLRFLQLLASEAVLAIERVRLTETLQESEVQYRELFDHAQDIVVTYTLEGIITNVNRAAEVLLGWSKEEAIGQHYSKFLPAASAAAMAERERKIANRERVSSIYEVDILRKDGSIMPVEARTRFVRNRDGKLSGILAIHRDITERKLAAEALQKERNFIAAILDTSSALIVVLDRHGYIVRFNRACEHLTGYSFDEVKGKQFWDLFIAPEEMESTKAAFAQLRSGVFPDSHENHWVTKDGSCCLITWSNTVLLDDTGKVDYIVGTGIDITARKHAFEELERANRLKEDFVNTMSHELRTPLNIILGYAELLHQGTFGPLNAQQREVLERIDRSAQELLDLVTSTLDLGRLQNQQSPLTIEQIRVEDLLADLEADIQQLNRKPTVQVAWQLSLPFPMLRTDPSKLKMVLKNLLTNALKFTEAGAVTVAVRPQQGGIEFCVSDTGIGIASEVLPIIFEPFRQADSSSTRRYGGVGLGLYLVRQVLILLGGSISVESEVGKGSTFRVWLPLSSSSTTQTIKP